jgi:type II secretory ATPase GspE/PulE/Tfp pilus assembly ATPase PilB-like protein
MRYQGDARRSFARSRGCSRCFESGYRGRSGIYELLESNGELRGMINDGADLDQLRAAHRGPTLLSEGLRLAAIGVTSLEEVGRVALAD